LVKYRLIWCGAYWVCFGWMVSWCGKPMGS